MSDEIKVTNTENNQENKCLCQSKGFRKFLTVALGTFVGVYCALSLFAAVHRPPMMPPCISFNPYNPPAAAFMRHPCKHKHHFRIEQRFDKQRFNKEFNNDAQKSQSPFESNHPKFN